MKLLLALLVALPLALAFEPSPFLTLSFNADGSNLSLRVMEDTAYYAPSFKPLPQGQSDYSWWLIDAGGRTFAAEVVYPNVLNWVPFSPEIRQVDIYRGNQRLLSLPISFCDNDRQCEPCSGERCVLLENALTCADCASGAADDYCDLRPDGVCDPDCQGAESDCADCRTCLTRTTTLNRTLCGKDLRGEICPPDIMCSEEGGFVPRPFQYADDSGAKCCVQGHCLIPPKERCRALGGNPCALGEEVCLGKVLFAEEMTDCCQAPCQPFSPYYHIPRAEEPDAEPQQKHSLPWPIIAEVLLLVGIAAFALRRRR